MTPGLIIALAKKASEKRITNLRAWKGTRDILSFSYVRAAPMTCPQNRRANLGPRSDHRALAMRNRPTRAARNPEFGDEAAEIGAVLRNATTSKAARISAISF